ncbi:MAG: PDDEXK nuclease domain-containing protein [Firmicutes bacterium]|nr:PDDEXK nuclease domain-containing protein [Bacillota bacterium]
MSKKKSNLKLTSDISTYENNLVGEVSHIIEKRKHSIVTQANSGMVMMFWEVGRHIDFSILNNKRADYGKQIVTTVSKQLVLRYGSSFSVDNMRRMMQFARLFSSEQIVAPMARQLSWSHFRELLSVKDEKARLFYVNESASRFLSAKGLRNIISRKTYERTEIANMQITNVDSLIPFNTFKDPYLLDILNLKGGYLEGDLESAILSELEKFILEFGKGFSFVERQKRISRENTDYYLDLLFYHRILKRLVAVELKIGKFHPKDKGQMEFYLKWLNENERQDDENEPIGLILCAESDRDDIRLMEMDKAGIAVAEYWTVFPPKKEFEEKLRFIMMEAKEVLERKKQLGTSNIKKQIEAFIEIPNDDED